MAANGDSMKEKQQVIILSFSDVPDDFIHKVQEALKKLVEETNYIFLITNKPLHSISREEFLEALK